MLALCLVVMSYWVRLRVDVMGGSLANVMLLEAMMSMESQMVLVILLVQLLAWKGYLFC